MANDSVVESGPATTSDERTDTAPTAALVVGCGFMGRGIAGCLLTGSKFVYLLDSAGVPFCEKVKQELADDLEDYHRVVLEQTDEDVLAKVRAETLSRIVCLDMEQFLSTKNHEALPHQIDYAFEAVFEDINVKCEVFAKLYEKLESKTMMCSNTSSLSLADIKQKLADEFGISETQNLVGGLSLAEIGGRTRIWKRRTW